MFTIKVETENSDQNLVQVWQCQHYSKRLTEDEHLLTLYGVPGQNLPTHIDLRNLPEDTGGKYSQDVYVMNDSGKTIDRF